MRNPNIVDTQTQTITVPACQEFVISLNVEVVNESCTWAGPFEATVTDTVLNTQLGKISDGSSMRLEQGTYEVEWPEVCGITVTVVTKVVNNSVEICNPDDIFGTTDFEFICNEDTNFYDRVERVYDNGVLQNETITPTTYPCQDPSPDFEQVRLCVNGFINILTNQIDPDGTVTTLNTTLTTEVCGQTIISQPWIVQFNNTAPHPVADLPVTSPVQSLTVTAIEGDVLVDWGLNGSATIPEGSSFSWGEGNDTAVDVSDLTLTGIIADAGISYIVHGEKV